MIDMVSANTRTARNFDIRMYSLQALFASDLANTERVVPIWGMSIGATRALQIAEASPLPALNGLSMPKYTP